MPSSFCIRITTAVLGLATLLHGGVVYTAASGDAVVPGQYLVRLKPGVDPALITAHIPGATVQSLRDLNLHLITLPRPLPGGSIINLGADPLVQYVEPNHVRSLDIATPNDPQYSSQWALPDIEAYQAWGVLSDPYLTSATAGSSRMTVVVIDTGADCTHPDFMNAGGTSTDSASGGQLSFALSYAFVPTTISPAACPWQDDYGHGTHVSGIIGAATNNNTGISALGYMLQVAEYKGLSSAGSGDDGMLANAIMAAADAGIPIVSASWGSPNYSQAMQDAITYAWQRNTLVVAAAGNSASSGLFFPADATYAVGVAATDSSNNPANFSNYGDHIRVAAPGVGILSTMPTYVTPMTFTNYTTLSGTSMSTPFVAALAGLVWSQTPGTSAAAVLQRIQQTAVSNNANGGWGPTTGYGVINAYNAVSGTLRTATLGALTGQVTDSNGNLIAAQVTAGSQSVTADSTGLYRIPALTMGTYPVTVTASGYNTLNLTATIAPGADTILPIVLGTTYGEFTGRVTNGGTAVPGAIVQALSNGLIVATAVADQYGNYNLWVTPAGTFNLQASSLLSNNIVVTGATVAANSSTTVNLSGGVPVIVTTSPAGLSVVVDGTTYTSTPVYFSWIPGSLHTLGTAATQGVSPTQYVFTGWSNSSNQSQTQTLTAGSSATTYTANFQTQYLLTTSVSAGGGGTISPASGFYNANAAVTITATPASGYQFTGFSGDLTGFTNPASITMSTAHSVTANFVAVASVTVTTTPANLNIIVDSLNYTAPHTFTWTLNSSHTLNTTATQTSGSTQYVFSQWNNTATQNQTITATGTTTYTASFTTQYQLTTSAGAGGSITPSSGFYNAGAVVAVTATPNSGNQFSGFSGALSGTTNPQNITMSGPMSVTANFVGTATVSVATSPSGLAIVVDGTTYTAPQSFNWTQGSSHTLDTVPTQGSGASQNVFVSWSNTASKTQTIVVNGLAAYTAYFQTQYLLTTATSPQSSGNVVASTGYYASGSTVSITASPATGYQFTGFSGDLSGPANPQSLVMNAPHSVTANFGCAYSLGAPSNSVGAIAYSGTVAVTAGTGCQWNAVSNSPWITITNGASGSGSGSVSYSTSVDSGASRTGSLTIAGVTFNVVQAGSATVVPDFDSNGYADLVWQSQSTRQVTVHYYGGAGGAIEQGSNYLNSAGAPGWHVAGAADFNGDGVPDLVWQNDTTGQVTVHYYGGPGGATEIGWNYLNKTGVAGWQIVAIADFNGDGVPDLVWQSSSTRQVTVNYYGGPGGATLLGWNWLNSAGAPGWHVAAAADFDGNGTPDLVWQNDTTSQITVHYYGGVGGATYLNWNWLNLAGAPGWSVRAATDINRDGTPDLIWQSDSTGQVTVHYYGGAGGAVYQSWNWMNSTGIPGWSVVN